MDKENTEINSDDEPYDYTPSWTDADWDKNTEYLSNHPLFCNDVEKLKENKELQALQSLLYEEDPDITAENFLEQANRLIKDKYLKQNSTYFLKQALLKYNEITNLNVKNLDILKRTYSNRAFINTKFRNYKKVIEDCDECLKIDKNFVKAYFRKANAYFFVEKYEESILTAELGLKLDKNNKDLLKIRNESDRINKKNIQKKKEEEELRVFKNSEFYKNCIFRGLKYSRNPGIVIPEMYEKKFLFNDKKEISCSLIIVYPEFHQFDFIKLMEENQTIISILGMIFENGLPWDQKNQYSLDTIECYIDIKLDNKEIAKKKFDLNKKLIDLLTTKSFIIHQVPEINLISKKSKHYNFFKENNIIIN